MPGLEEKRAELLPAGSMLLVTALELFEVETLTISDWALRDRATYDATVAPAMQEQMDFARNYGNEANRAQRRGQAMAQTGITFDAAADMSRRALQSYGVDPSAGRYAGLDAGLAAKRAAAQALAGTNADAQTEAMGQEYLDRAIQRGMVLPGQAAP